jgi:hypothetical protein
LLSAKEAANFVKLSIAAFWRNVCNRRLPEPVYPAPLVVDADTHEVTPTPAWEKVVALVEAERPVMLVLDPLVEFHTCPENDNAQMKAVITHLRDVARVNKLAAVLIHHTRKSAHNPGDLDASRGASAIGGAARFAVEVTTMIASEARQFGLPEERRRFFFRVDNARAAYAPPAESAEWFEKVGYDIGPARDDTPAVVPWTPPKPIAADEAMLDRLVEAIAAGWTNPDTGELQAWSPKITTQSDRSIRVLLARESVDAASMGLVLRQLLDDCGIETGVFRERRGRRAKGLRASDEKPAVVWLGDTDPDEAEHPRDPHLLS